MSINYINLKSELSSDPAGLGYGPFWTTGQDMALANLINQPRSGTTVFRGLINGSEIAAATAASAYTTLSTANQNLYNAIVCASGGVDTTSLLVRSSFTLLFAPATSTGSAISALMVRQGSRAESLYGQPVSSNDVAIARRS